MLVLARKKNERIVIPAIDTVIEVLEIKGNSVRLGIRAPGGVQIVREELLQSPAHRAPVEPRVNESAYAQPVLAQ